MSEQIEATAPAAEKVKREAVTKRTWLADGAVTKDPRTATGLKIEVIGAGDYQAEIADYAPAEVRDEVAQYLAEIRRLAPVINAQLAFGINIVLTNTMGGLKGEDAFEAIMDRHETMLSGEWSDRKGGGGPRLSLLSQAVVAAYAKAGHSYTVEQITKLLTEKGEDYRKALIGKDGNKQVRAEYDRLRAEAAQERAKKSLADVGEGEALPDLGL